LISVANILLKKSNDKNELKAAITLAKKSNELKTIYSNYETISSLYYKLGMKKEGKKNEEIAVKLKKEYDEKYGASFDTLEGLMFGGE
jgi:hypothetical protein